MAFAKFSLLQKLVYLHGANTCDLALLESRNASVAQDTRMVREWSLRLWTHVTSCALVALHHVITDALELEEWTPLLQEAHERMDAYSVAYLQEELSDVLLSVLQKSLKSTHGIESRDFKLGVVEKMRQKIEADAARAM